MFYSNLAFSRRFAMVLAIVLSGCATTGGGKDVGQGFDQLMTDSEAAGKAGLQEKSLDLLERATKEYPARKEPWLRLAQTYFSSQDYGQAILASEEVLQRDGKDLVARSILAVSGLRVSARALGQLREDQVITGDVKVEAKLLARTLRDTLGEAELFSVGAKGAADSSKTASEQPRKTSTTPPRVIKSTAPPVAASSPVAKVEKPQIPVKSGSSDPFGALK
jgi:hypothetical protein